MQLPPVSAIIVEKVAPIWFSAPALPFSFPCLPARALLLCGLPSLHLTPVDLIQPVPSALTIQPAWWFVPLSFVSRAGETPLFGFPALWHRYEAADSIQRFPLLWFVRISVSHRLCELSCIISRPVPRLISSRKHLWAFLYRGFPSNNGPHALTCLHPLVSFRLGGHLICFRES